MFVIGKGRKGEEKKSDGFTSLRIETEKDPDYRERQFKSIDNTFSPINEFAASERVESEFLHKSNELTTPMRKAQSDAILKIKKKQVVKTFTNSHCKYSLNLI